MGLRVCTSRIGIWKIICLVALNLIAMNPSLYGAAYVWIYSKNGLKIRTSPDSNSESLGILPYGTKLKLTGNHKGEWLEIKGIKARWARVESEDGLKGYMFSGFLLPVQAPPLSLVEKPISSWKESLGDLKQPLKFSENMRSVELMNLTRQSAFMIFRALYQIPDEIPYPSKFRNLYLHSDVLDQGARHWKIHELRVTRKKEYEIDAIVYQLKNQAGTLTGTLKFGSPFTIEEHFEVASKESDAQKVSEQVQPKVSDSPKEPGADQTKPPENETKKQNPDNL